MSKFLWHTTTHGNAAAILATGFQNRPSVRRGSFATYDFKREGVWVSTLPALDDELFDAPGLFGFDALKQAFLRITPRGGIPLEEVSDASWVAGRQFIIDARHLNDCTVEQTPLAEVVRFRVQTMSSGARERLTQWVARDRGYGIEFLAQVRAALREVPT